MSTSYGKAMQVLSCAPAQVRDSFSHYEGGISPRLGYWAIRGDQRKRLMGAAFPLADLSISGQLWEVALPDILFLVLQMSGFRGQSGTGLHSLPSSDNW